MLFYDEEIIKRLKKNLIPKNIFQHMNNAFKALDIMKDLSLFDIKKIKESETVERVYYRLRKGKYRALFYIEEQNIYIISIEKREDVYRKWQ
jgi:mRNA interferase RelE/StbE